MKKLVEVVDEHGNPTMIPFHRVIRVVKRTSRASFMPSVIFELDGGLEVVIPAKEGEPVWGLYREWVSTLS